MGNKFSDNNTGRSSLTSRRRLYADLPLSFTVHPNTQDITSLNDIDAVKQAVKNLVLTNFTERPFQPRIGSNITALLFEPADPFTEMAIKDEVLRVLDEYEPRVNGVFVEVIDESDRNSYQINIQFNVIFSDQREETNFYLERTR
jgi:phage baseplate assembly protein W|tara:strand:- start:324 stop:758 length:435 start_codon:yes stop_codon:yes gene_type:complete